MFLGLNDHNKALKYLDEALHEHAARIIYLTIDPRLEPLLKDTRFIELATHVGLPLKNNRTPTGQNGQNRSRY